MPLPVVNYNIIVNIKHLNFTFVIVRTTTF